jgi:uncharacterized protein (UPF0305 family)
MCLEKKKASEEKTEVTQSIQNKIYNSISKALKELEDQDFKTDNKKDQLSKILTEYSIFIKEK